MSRSSLTTNVHLGIIAMLVGILPLSTMDAAAKLLHRALQSAAMCLGPWQRNALGPHRLFM